MTVLDLSKAALTAAKERIGDKARQVKWIVADVTTWSRRAYDVWHDHTAFHFLINAADQTAYVGRLRRALRHGGHAIIDAPDGPENAAACRSRDTMRMA